MNDILFRFLIRILLLVFIVPVIFSGSVLAQDRKMPFSPGEKLTFQLKWGVIPAGEASLEVLPIETINGIPAYHFVMTARSYPFLDLFYKVRDRIEAFADTGMTHSLLYKKKQREGRTKRDIIVRFDWNQNEATYTRRNRSRTPVKLMPGCFDPLSVFYYSRLLDMKIGTIEECPVSDGKKCVIGRASVIKRQTLHIDGNTYETFLIEPELKDIGGVFKKSKDAKIKIWITDDDRRIPVMIKSKVAVGSFVGEIMTIKEGSVDPMAN